MFLSVWGHTSELSIANHSPRSTVSRLKCGSDTISSWFENHQPQTEDKNLLRHLCSFNSKLESNGFQVDRNYKFSEGIFSTPVIFRATSKLFGLQGCSDDKNWLDFSSISSRFVDFAVQLCFRCKFSVNEERRSSQVWQWRDFLDQSRFFATHSNQWNCFILNRS